MLLFHLILLVPLVSAGPTSASAGSSIPLTRRKPATGDRISWLKAQADALRVKYAVPGCSTAKRANTGTESLTNRNVDLTYYGTVAVGTPGMLISVLSCSPLRMILLPSANFRCDSRYVCAARPSLLRHFTDALFLSADPVTCGSPQAIVNKDVLV
jgi:hypothetical protein